MADDPSAAWAAVANTTAQTAIASNDPKTPGRRASRFRDKFGVVIRQAEPIYGEQRKP
jgi:hypothetical protein